MTVIHYEDDNPAPTYQHIVLQAEAVPFELTWFISQALVKMNGTGDALNTVVCLKLNLYAVQHDGAVFVHFQNTFPDFDGQAVSYRQGVIFPNRNILRLLYFLRVVANYLTVLVITHIFLRSLDTFSVWSFPTLTLWS